MSSEKMKNGVSESESDIIFRLLPPPLVLNPYIHGKDYEDIDQEGISQHGLRSVLYDWQDKLISAKDNIRNYLKDDGTVDEDRFGEYLRGINNPRFVTEAQFKAKGAVNIHSSDPMEIEAIHLRNCWNIFHFLRDLASSLTSSYRTFDFASDDAPITILETLRNGFPFLNGICKVNNLTENERIKKGGGSLSIEYTTESNKSVLLSFSVRSISKSALLSLSLKVDGTDIYSTENIAGEGSSSNEEKILAILETIDKRDIPRIQETIIQLISEIKKRAQEWKAAVKAYQKDERARIAGMQKDTLDKLNDL